MEMIRLPKFTENSVAERMGVYQVASIITSLGLIFRETQNIDIGIDAQIEFVDANQQATGQIVAVQIKSGDSYLHDANENWVFYPQEKHKLYWESFPIPVFLMVYSPQTKSVYYTDVSYFYSIPGNTRKPILIPKENILSVENKRYLFETTGNFYDQFLGPEKLLNQMISTGIESPSFSISYIDLFIQGLTNLCRHLYFSMSLVYDLVNFSSKGQGFSISPDDHNFLHNYVRLLISQNLAKINYADYLIDWKERGLQSEFLAPITSRGFSILEGIKSLEKENQSIMPDVNLVRERSISMDYLESDYERLEKGVRLFSYLREKMAE